MTRVFAVGDPCYLDDETGQVVSAIDLGDGLWQVRVRYDTTGVEYAYESRYYYQDRPTFGFFWRPLVKSRKVKIPLLKDPESWLVERLRTRFYLAHQALQKGFSVLQGQGLVESQTLLVDELERLAERFGG